MTNYTTVCQQDQPSADELTGRVQIITIPRGAEAVYITSDNNKFYARTHFGMCGEGVIEVGYSSVNGAPGPGFNPACVENVREHLRTLAAASDITECNSTDEALIMLWGLAYNADRAYNTWLGNHQGEY